MKRREICQSPFAFDKRKFLETENGVGGEAVWSCGWSGNWRPPLVGEREKVKRCEKEGGKSPTRLNCAPVLRGIHTGPCENINKVTGERPLASGIISDSGTVFVQTQPDAAA